MLLEVREGGLFCERGVFAVDPVAPVERAIVTSPDPLRVARSRAIVCSERAAPFVRRLTDAPVEAVAFGARLSMNGVTVSLHPSGHALGAAQVRVASEGRVEVATGAWKRAPDATCPPLEPLRADVIIIEAPFALPIFRWPSFESELERLRAWIARGGDEARASVLFARPYGKAARVLAALGAAALVDEPTRAALDDYRAAGVALPATRPLPARKRDAVGELVLLAPGADPSRLGPRETALASGLVRIRGTRRRRALDRGFVISDHGDWDDALAVVDAAGAREVVVLGPHGDALARFLAETRGLAARAAPWPFASEAEDRA